MAEFGEKDLLDLQKKIARGQSEKVNSFAGMSARDINSLSKQEKARISFRDFGANTVQNRPSNIDINSLIKLRKQIDMQNQEGQGAATAESKAGTPRVPSTLPFFQTEQAGTLPDGTETLGSFTNQPTKEFNMAGTRMAERLTDPFLSPNAVGERPESLFDLDADRQNVIFEYVRRLTENSESEDEIEKTLATIEETSPAVAYQIRQALLFGNMKTEKERIEEMKAKAQGSGGDGSDGDGKTYGITDDNKLKFN